MALYPCAIHGAPYRGAASHVYPGVIYGSQTTRTHVRCCAGCAQVVLDLLSLSGASLDDPQRGASGRDHACHACDSPDVQDGAALFVTAYVDNVRSDWLARLCAQCAERAGEAGALERLLWRL